MIIGVDFLRHPCSSAGADARDYYSDVKRWVEHFLKGRHSHATRPSARLAETIELIPRDYFMVMTDDEVRVRIATIPHWYHPIELRPGIVTPGSNDAHLVLDTLELPSDCRGLRALDLGTRDGFFAFELERRGAEVVAVDYLPKTSSGFAVAAELLGSRVTYLQRNLYELTTAELGTFDLVLFLGLLYHLPDPLGALRVVRNLTRSQMYLETLVLAFGPEMDELPLMRFFAGSSWAGDPTNYWGPNVRCVEQMLGETEFATRRVVRLGERAVFACETITSPADAYYMEIATGRRTP